MQDDREHEQPDHVSSGATPRVRRMFSGSQALTDREHDVLEVHRAHILAKCGARNTADLLRIVLNGQK